MCLGGGASPAAGGDLGPVTFSGSSRVTHLYLGATELLGSRGEWRVARHRRAGPLDGDQPTFADELAVGVGHGVACELQVESQRPRRLGVGSRR